MNRNSASNYAHVFSKAEHRFQDLRSKTSMNGCITFLPAGSSTLFEMI